MLANGTPPLLRLPRELRDAIRSRLITGLCRTEDIHALVISKDCLGISGANKQLRAEYFEAAGVQSLATAQNIVFPVHDFDFSILHRFLERLQAADDGRRRELAVLLTLSPPMHDCMYPDYGPWKQCWNVRAVTVPARVSVRYHFAMMRSESLLSVACGLESWLWLWWQNEWTRKDDEPSREFVRTVFAYLNRMAVAQGEKTVCCEQSLQDDDWSRDCVDPSCHCKTVWPPL